MRKKRWSIVSIILIASVTFALGQDNKVPRAVPQSQAARAQIEQEPLWIVTCTNANPAAQLRCRAEQVLSVTQTKQRLVSVIFDRNDEGAIIGRITLPHGILFDKGIEVWVGDGVKHKVAVTNADENGSYADLPLEPEFLKELKGGPVLRIKMQTVSNEDLVMELSLNGFGAAIHFVETNPT